MVSAAAAATHSKRAPFGLEDDATATSTKCTYGALDDEQIIVTLVHEHERPLLEKPPRRVKRAGRFRYLIGSLLILAITMNTYANYTIYIAAIGMISNDVLQSGLTELRARHLSNDPLASGTNVAAPGTCPVEALASVTSLLKYTSTTINSNDQPELNATELSAREHLAMALDTTALLTSVHERLANGQLVDWTISQRGYIFTAHNIGGILLAVPISRLGLRFGSKWMVFACILITGLRMLALPSLAGNSPFWATFLFELTTGGWGASIGILAYPLASAWLLPDEANFFLAMGQVFILIGTAATNFISTQLLAAQIAWSWCFYLPGVVLCATALGWLALGADRPEESRWVDEGELELLAVSVEARDENNKQAYEQYTSCFCQRTRDLDCPALKLQRTPNWWAIFSCPTVWALIAVNFAYHWNAKIATLWPTFFANILHLDASTIGIITGLKGIVALLFGLSFAFGTRKLVVERPFGISLTAYRRANQVIATALLGLSVLLMVALDCDFWANFASVMLTPLITGFNAISHEQMPLDLTAEDSGVLVSVVRLLAVGDIVALPASSYLLSFAPDALAGDRLTWRLVWLSGLGIKILTCVLFVFMARSKPKCYSRLEPAGACKSAGVASSR